MLKKRPKKHFDFITKTEITPYQKLIGAIFRQLIEDALNARYYNRMYREHLSDSKKHSAAAMYDLKDKRTIANRARKFIYSDKLERLILLYKVDLQPDYFRRKFVEMQREHTRLSGVRESRI